MELKHTNLKGEIVLERDFELAIKKN